MQATPRRRATVAYLVALANVASQNQKVKKIIVNPQTETVTAVDCKPPERTHFARIPIPPHLAPP